MTTRAVRRRSGFSPCSVAGPPPSPFPQGVGDVGELASLPHGKAAFLRLLSRAARSAR